ncbi:hypothetical protein [Streptomyces sp. I05A-00742]|uniref:hypothetical protein n=1 Tax=Streptomyces sp. I05A-00742 TaxID=2732853 RepID=UPI001487941E|nr:hypothetical protein [Streptomyces sp. I05A-00742]
MRDTKPSERPEPTEHFIFDDSRTIVLEYGFQWDPVPGRQPIERERPTAHHAVRALAELCAGLIRPVTLDMTRTWVDVEYGWSEGRPPRWNWFLRTPQAPSPDCSMYVDPQLMDVAALDERSMPGAVDRVLDEPCEAPEGKRPAWVEIRVRHTWARLPEPDRHLGNDELRIDDYDNKARRVSVPFECADGRVWVTAPGIGVWCPFLLRVGKSPGTVDSDGPSDGPEYDEFIELTIDVNWSFWWVPGEGRAMLDRAVDRLLRQGWRKTFP